MFEAHNNKIKFQNHNFTYTYNALDGSKLLLNVCELEIQQQN